jgi:uncharacterized membrane protein YhaH (DUF805 family)
MTDPTLDNEKLDRYAPPKTRVADTYAGSGQTQPVRLFSAKGRMGRLRYMCWAFVSSLVFGLIAVIVMLMTFGATVFAYWGRNTLEGPPALGLLALVGILLVFVITIAWFIFFIMLMIQRAHDMGWSGWSILVLYGIVIVLSFVGVIVAMITKSPLVMVLFQIIGFLISLVWMVKPGTPGPNRFGPPPAPTPLPVQIVAWVLIFFMVIGIIGDVVVGVSAYSKIQHGQQPMLQTE